jgi:two-component system CheB/CheR fusion protein
VAAKVKSAVVKKKSSLKKEKKEKSFPVVGIGASAGGLEAITQLLQNLPSRTGMAFIYVQHLSPDYKSVLVSLLAKTTSMKVLEVKDRIAIKPDTFYVIPPDKVMTVLDGHIKLQPRKRNHIINLPIDTFFFSVAEHYKEGAIGIVLSGSASDGTRGLKAIKSVGGLTFAQDDSAKFNGMPRSAITEGAVDFILSPKEIAVELMRLSKDSYSIRNVLKKGEEDEIENHDPELKTILRLLYKESGVDFSHYKMPTIKRRILRRMLLYKIKTLKKYVSLLNQNNKEIDILYHDLLIHVTSFFRESNAYAYLKAVLFPKILKGKKTGKALRIWVPACSTGEEAYSVAILLLELRGKTSDIPIQLFATDLSADAISKARIGIYSTRDLAAVSPKRLYRFFTRLSDGNYQIKKEVRDMCVFATHNILSDPPFSNIDFISCCNLLIYLDNPAQKKSIATFHYALNNNGYLMLGKSETTGAAARLFTILNKRFRIYSRKKNSAERYIPDFASKFSHNDLPEKNITVIPAPVKSSGLESVIDAVLVSRYTPACVVINHEMEIIQFRGETSLYLAHTSGKASFNILKMAHPEITFELRDAIRKAIKTKHTVRKPGIQMQVGSDSHLVNIEVSPLKIESSEPLLLILFIEQHLVEVFPPPDGKSNTAAKDRRIKKLMGEISGQRDEMRSVIREQESFYEELQTAHEEVVSSNEELRTVNEELETSKEEIESTNEELITTNNELVTRNELLSESYNYSQAIFETMHNPMIVLDKNFNIRSVNKSFSKKFLISESEAEGISLYQMANRQWNIPALRELLEDVISKNSIVNNFEIVHTFPHVGEKKLLLNARRIVQKSHGDQLILIFIQDITEEVNLLNRERELNNDLIKANKKLEKINAELASFGYVASHDLQEPLRKIQIFISRILESDYENLSARSKDSFDRVKFAAKQMQTLIEDLLIYSRSDGGDRNFEKVNLTKIAKEILSDLHELNEKNVSVEMNELGYAFIIPFQFRQVLQNLIGNSIKFSIPGRPLKISLHGETGKGKKFHKELIPDENYYHLSVSDNGIGFDMKYKDSIFEIFKRLHDKDEYSGTGIGLAIVKRIVGNHHGIITATGKVNKGTTFDIFIPAVH